MAFEFEVVTPEEEGIASGNVIRFLKRLEEQEIPMHSMLLIRNGKLLTETYYEPYNREELHRMFSVTKSMVSLAIGLLCEEGRVKLEDRIVEYFPEKLPKEGVHPYIAAIRIRDMLRMATAHEKTTYKCRKTDDWVSTFFLVEPSHLPGAVFSYDTSSTHTLAALVEKLAGMELLEYLRLKFLNELGFSKKAYCVKDPMGVSMGGSGLMATPYDMAKVMYLISQGGRWHGKQLLPEWYLKLATSKQIATYAKGQTLEEMQGYGYQFWCTRNRGYACYGMGGQLMCVLPEENLILITTADTQERQGGVQLIYDAFWEEIYEKMEDRMDRNNQMDYRELRDKWSKRALICPKGKKSSSQMEHFNHITFQMDQSPRGFGNITLHLEKEEGIFVYTDEAGMEYSISFGLEKNREGILEPYHKRILASGVFLSEDTFLLKVQVVEECVGSILIELAFGGDTVTTYMKKYEETYFKEFDGFLSGKKKYSIEDNRTGMQSMA